MRKETKIIWETGDIVTVKLPKGKEGYHGDYYGEDIGVIRRDRHDGKADVDFYIRNGEEDLSEDYTVDAIELRLATTAEKKRLEAIPPHAY